MTSPMDLPLFGKVKLFETSKPELLNLWQDVLSKNEINLRENAKVESITRNNGYFMVMTLNGEQFTAKQVILTIGRRGSPRKLGIPGENMEKVTYRLLEPESITGKNIIVVGGGDSAVEAALQLADQNNVILSYRKDSFGRIKPKNKEKINAVSASGRVNIRYNSKLTAIDQKEVTLCSAIKEGESEKIENDLVYIFAGGELPTQFLSKIGIAITKKFGEAVLKH